MGQEHRAQFISERKIEELQKNEKKYRNIFQYSPLGIFHYDPETIITDCNDKFVEIIGSSYEILVGLNMRQYLKDEKIIEEVERSLSQGFGFYQNTYVSITANKSTPVRIIFRGIIGDDNSIIGGTGLVEDISKRKSAEQALAENERNFRELFNSITDLVYTQDLQGRFLSINPALNQLFGYAPHEFVGRRAADFMPERNRQLFESEYLETLKKQGRYEGVSSYYRKDGTKIYIEYKSELVAPKNGTPHISGIGRDVTERILAEKAKKQLESRLSQAQKMEAIGQLAGGVAHDLNNLLSPILGYGEILKQDPKLEENQKNQLDHILQAGMRARELMSQLLAFSRKQTLEFKPVNLNSILVLFEKLLRRTIREDIDLKIHLTENIGTVQADVGQLEQVVMNLAVNAQDAMPAGGTLSIETQSVAFNQTFAARHSDINPGWYVMLAVRDTGEGMPLEIQEKIYDPFFTTKETGKGTGLGLSTVYGIIKQHGGHIQVNSELNQGTAFKIFLPICEVPQEETSTPQAPKHLKGTETIVVAEDNPQVLQLVLTILELQGYTVLSAESGAQTLSVLEQHTSGVSLLLTDVVMPDMNGKELYQQVSKKYPGIKILYMSGYTEDVIGRHGVLEKDTLYIQKPFTVEGLVQKVREVLDR